MNIKIQNRSLILVSILSICRGILEVLKEVDLGYLTFLLLFVYYLSIRSDHISKVRCDLEIKIFLGFFIGKGMRSENDGDNMKWMT
jgi:hypothetical protein